ncbi:MAG TPA: HPP family protein [Prosthecobacter sp.]
MPISYLRKIVGVELVEVSLTEKIVAAVGGGVAILLLACLSVAAMPQAAGAAIVASMGASAVLLYAAPHGQLSQPWPVIGGHGISALIGVACAQWVHHPFVAAACAVGLSIGAMHQLRCIHPPGGATAFTAVMGGSSVHGLGFSFVLFPVLTNAVAMVLLAVLLNSAFHWRRYPAILSRRPPHVQDPDEPTHEEVIAAIRSIDSFVDISEEDLLRLVDLLSHHQMRPKVPAPSIVTTQA